MFETCDKKDLFDYERFSIKREVLMSFIIIFKTLLRNYQSQYQYDNH